MKSGKASVLLAALLSAALATSAFGAGGRGGYGGGGRHGGGHWHGGGHGHSHVRLGVGFGFYGGYWPYYGYPYAYYPSYSYPAAYPYPAYAYYPYQAAAPAYVEQGQPAPSAAAPAAGYWYYCNESQAYYPHVQQCAGQWQRVPPQPPS